MDRLCSLGLQVCVKECEMGVLILGIIMDVLVHVSVQHSKRIMVG